MTADILGLPKATTQKWRDLIDTPAVIIDLDIVERNILNCQQRCDELGLRMRPHIKTHKLPILAFAQLAAGAIGVTAQKISEAEVMVDAGIKDVLISYNVVGEKKLTRLRKLAKRCTLSTVADSQAVVRGLADAFLGSERALDVLVECDTGMGRCGVRSAKDALHLAQLIDSYPQLNFAGLMTYPAVGKHREAAQWLDAASSLLVEAGLRVACVSSGGTPDLFHFEKSAALTEYRPGSYIYNDRSLIVGGACSQEDCALTVATTVIGEYADERIVTDSGSKILTSDLFGMTTFGLVVGHPEYEVRALNEEHGIIFRHAGSPSTVGTVLQIIPNHACVVSNMVDEVHFVRGEFYVGKEVVAARGTVL